VLVKHPDAVIWGLRGCRPALREPVAAAFALGMLTEMEDHGADLGAYHRVDLEAAAVTATAGSPGERDLRPGPGSLGQPGTDPGSAVACPRSRVPGILSSLLSNPGRSPLRAVAPSGRSLARVLLPPRMYRGPPVDQAGGTAGQRRI